MTTTRLVEVLDIGSSRCPWTTTIDESVKPLPVKVTVTASEPTGALLGTIDCNVGPADWAFSKLLKMKTTAVKKQHTVRHSGGKPGFRIIQLLPAHRSDL